MDTCFKLRLLLIEKSDILFSKTAFPGCINTDFYILFFFCGRFSIFTPAQLPIIRLPALCMITASRLNAS